METHVRGISKILVKMSSGGLTPHPPMNPGHNFAKQQLLVVYWGNNL